MSTVPASAAVASLVPGIGDSFHLTGAQPASIDVSANTGCIKSLWILPAALILAACKCHRADHRAYAAGLIASLTSSRQGVIGNRMHHSWVRSFDGADSAPRAGNCPVTARMRGVR
jgi:hypothetical protein